MSRAIAHTEPELKPYRYARVYLSLMYVLWQYLIIGMRIYQLH